MAMRLDHRFARVLPGSTAFQMDSSQGAASQPDSFQGAASFQTVFTVAMTTLVAIFSRIISRATSHFGTSNPTWKQQRVSLCPRW